MAIDYYLSLFALRPTLPLLLAICMYVVRLTTMIEVPVYMLLMRCRRGLANSVSRRVTIDLLVQKFRTGSELMRAFDWVCWRR